MAARTRTLTQLRDAVADRADVAVAASGVRNTHTLVDARINRAVQRWLLMVAESGDDTNLRTTRTATATSTTRDASNWAPYQYIAQPSGLLFLRGVDIWDGNTPIAMLDIAEAQRNDARFSDFLDGGGTGMPVFYRLGGTNAAGSSLIQIFPWADAAYTVDVRYIQAHTDLSSGSDTIDFIDGGEEWVANDAAMQTLISEGLAGTPAYGACGGMNVKIEAEIRFSLARRASIQKIDTRGRREALKRLSGSSWRLL